MGKVSAELKSNMVVLSRENLTTRQIAERLGCCKSTVAFVLQKYRETGTTGRKKGSGRPRKTTRVEDHFLRIQSLRNRFKTSTDLRNDLFRARGTNISSSLVRKRLLKEGLRARRPVKKPVLTQLHRQKRLLWAREHISWTEDMWNTVIFSDESKFKLHVGDGRLLVRRRQGERLSDECMQLLPPKSAGVMVWGCFSGSEKGRLCFVSSKVTADVYIDILKNELEPSVLTLFGDTCDFIFQQDNAPCHTAKKVQEYMEEKNITLMKWPPYSPDLNPIENIWALMKLKVAKHRPASVNSLKDLVEDTWQSIPSSIFKNLTASMSRRCQAVIAARGGPTKY